MRVSTLPSPGLLSNGIRIRIEAAKAISAVEINAGIPANGGKSSTAKQLSAFFTACSDAIATYIDTTVPTLVSAVITAALPTRIVLTFNDDLDGNYVPATGDFAITEQVKTVATVTVSGTKVYLDFATAFVAGAASFAYTQGTNKLQDTDANLVANITATAVTNGIV